MADDHTNHYKKFWDDIRKQFTGNDETRIYQLKSAIKACNQQPNETIMAYYGRLKRLWDDLNECDPIPVCSCSGCTCGLATQLSSRREAERVLDFLMGLDSRYASVRSQLLHMKPSPNLGSVYSMLIQEEAAHAFTSVRNESKSEPLGGNRSQRGFQGDPRRNAYMPRKTVCEACKREGHGVQTCFRVTGRFPAWWGDRPRDIIIWPPSDHNEKGRSGGMGQSGRATGSARAHVAAGASTSRGSSLNEGDRLDFPGLISTEWDELTHFWNVHKTQRNDQLHDGTEAKEEGNIYFKAQRYEEAVRCYSKSIYESPTAVAYANRAMAYIKLNKFIEAEKDCTDAMRMDDSYFKAYARRGMARAKIGNDLKGALEDVQVALKLEPNNQEMTALQAQLKCLNEGTQAREEGNGFFKDGKFEDAIKCYSRSIVQSPTTIAYSNRAMAYLELNKFVEAEKDCTEALKIDSHHFKAYARRAIARTKLGRDLEGALEDVKAALDFEPNSQEMKDLHTELKRITSRRQN